MYTCAWQSLHPSSKLVSKLLTLPHLTSLDAPRLRMALTVPRLSASPLQGLPVFMWLSPDTTPHQAWALLQMAELRICLIADAGTDHQLAMAPQVRFLSVGHSGSCCFARSVSRLTDWRLLMCAIS